MVRGQIVPNGGAGRGTEGVFFGFFREGEEGVGGAVSLAVRPPKRSVGGLGECGWRARRCRYDLQRPRPARVGHDLQSKAVLGGVREEISTKQARGVYTLQVTLPDGAKQSRRVVVQ